MAILYAPIIDTPLPSFYMVNNKINITIPIVENKFVYKGQYTKFALLIKNSNTGAIVCDPIFSANASQAHFEFDAYYEKDEQLFPLLTIGNYYKIQIAYATNNEIGVYSSAALVKYTSEPRVQGSVNDGIITFEYTNNDPNERIDTYSIAIYDEKTLLYDTGILLHRRDSDKIEGSSLDTYQLTSIDQLSIPGDLSDNFNYRYVYTYTTINAYTDTVEFIGTGSAKVYSRFLDSNFVTLQANLDEENACVNLVLNNMGAPSNIVAGSYIISKLKVNDVSTIDYENNLNWEYVANFIITKSLTGTYTIANDYCIENGNVYVYAIQQYNKYGIYSTRHYSNTITIKFDYSYLVDATHQLKINFNPKISSFKNDLLESKVDTIGSQYPYIFRNGIVKYKEFPIGGLLSKRSDEDNLFTNIQFFKDDTIRTTTPHEYDNNIIIDEIFVEQQYKTEVLEWLNNGQPKLFKSPTEGNFIVRLLNVSLTPEDRLGRMLHSFSATAYEIAAYTSDNLLRYAIISDNRDQQIDEYEIQKIGSGNVADLISQPLILEGTNIGLQIYGVNPIIGSNQVTVTIQYNDNSTALLTVGASGQLIIQPGDYDIKKISVSAIGANIIGTYFYTYNKIEPIPFGRYKRVQLDQFITLREDVNDTGDYIDIIPLLTEINIETIRDLHSISHLQFIRRYPIRTRPELNYTVKVKYSDDTEYQLINLDDAYEYQMDNTQKITSLLIPNGVKSILCYKMVTIYTVKE